MELGDSSFTSRNTFGWSAPARFDDRGNAVVYEYSTKVRTRIVFDMSLANKRNRAVTGRSVNRYTKWIEDGKVESKR
jgi:hypothetical protein